MSGYGTYRTAQKVVSTPIQIEADLIGKITREIELQRHQGGPDYVKVLHQNVQLWNALSADLLCEENKYPTNLKASLISLSIWVEKHTRKVLHEGGDVDALIDVNRSIVSGLFEAHRNQQCPDQATPHGAVEAFRAQVA